jgi:hypothetical protein
MAAIADTTGDPAVRPQRRAESEVWLVIARQLDTLVRKTAG